MYILSRRDKGESSVGLFYCLILFKTRGKSDYLPNNNITPCVSRQYPDPIVKSLKESKRRLERNNNKQVNFKTKK
jgi:hypothetical protein